MPARSAAVALITAHGLLGREAKRARRSAGSASIAAYASTVYRTR